MTISTDAASVAHVANGTATQFSFSPIEGLRADNVVVTTVTPDGTETTRSLGVDYVLGASGVQFFSPPANGTLVIIQRVEPLVQPDTFAPNAPFPAAVVERRLDRIVHGLQQIAERFSRVLRVPLGDFSTPLLPPRNVRADKLLGFDAQGRPIAAPGVTIDGVLVSAFGETLLGAANAAAGRSILGAASNAELAAVDAAAVKKAGDTMSGDLTISRAAPSFRLRSSTPSTRAVRFQTGADDRFLIGVSATAESGGNTGSNFFVRRVLDNGTGADVLVVERSSGRVRVEGSVPLRLPAVDPSHDDDAVRKSFADSFAWVESGTLPATGASVTVTGLPADVKEIIVNFHLVSTSGTQPVRVQVGTVSTFSGTYNSSSMRATGTSVTCANSTSGFLLNTNSAAATMSGIVHMTRFSPQAPNTWQATGMLTFDVSGGFITTTGHCVLSGAPVARVRIICGGSDVFDSGVFNVMWRRR